MAPAIACCLVLGVLTFAALSSGLTRGLDDWVMHSLHGAAVRQAATVQGAKALSLVTMDPGHLLAAAALTLWLLVRGERRVALGAGLTLLVGLWIAGLIKQVVQRPRPALLDPVAHAAGYSFPSGHAFDITLTALVVALVVVPRCRPAVRQRWIGLLAAAVLAVDFARLYLGVHYLTDVVAGCALAAAWVAASAYLGILPTDWSPRYRRRSSR